MERDKTRRDRDNSPRRFQRDRSPRRYNGESNERNDDYRDRRGGDYRDRRGGERPLTSKSNRNYDNSIFVGGVTYDCDSGQLREHFARIGNVIRADIVTQNGKHRGMGTVEFSNKDEVRKAISEFDHTEFMGREIFVRQDNPPPQQRSHDRFGGRDNRYPPRDRYDDRGYGRDRYPPRDRYDDRGYGRDYGYDRYPPRRDDRYSSRRDDRYPPRREDRPPRREGPLYEVFVGNLPFSINWQALKDLFKPVGSVISADVKLDDYGRSRGFGIVSFENAEDVQNAVAQLHGTDLEGRTIDVREGKNNANYSGASNSNQQSSNQQYNNNNNNNNNNTNTNYNNGNQNSEFTEGVEGNGPKTNTIYVDDLPFATANDDLVELFQTVAPVIKAEIKYFNGRPSGSAVVEFGSDEDAESAISKLDQYLYGGLAQLKSFLNDKRISLDGYNLIPSFQHDIESGLSSKFFNLNEHNSQDSRKGLDEVSKLEILKIMDTKKITFDEARLEFTRSKFSENNIAEDGTPLDPRAVTFGK
ncbi:hypothetical protein WICMUC_000731 [Wickerhamomyces mucosus]|uniref:RRM domain-containing protein n=1 Tax=Wickerhamomyces mucosus TaxID=1378264 RepID=A0A9P8PY68_9ASCO|nr:hypothetical protein WICMUC_000731 [Wickerhamomyces mucosus]